MDLLILYINAYRYKKKWRIFILNFNSFSDCNSDDMYSLRKYLNKNFGDVESLNHIRNGNYYVLLLNGKYIVRIRRLQEFHYESQEPNISYNALVKLNAKYEQEISVCNYIYEYFRNRLSNSTYIPLFKYVHNGIFCSHKIGIYEKLEGVPLISRDYKILLGSSQFCPKKTGLSLARHLSLLHSIDAVSAGMITPSRIESEPPEVIDRSIYELTHTLRLLEEQSELIECLIGKNEHIYNSIVNRISKYYSHTSDINGCVVNHNALEWGHILVKDYFVSGYIDWEHSIPSPNGWKDLSDIYNNFVMGSLRIKEKPSTNHFEFWRNFLSYYECPIRKRILNKEEVEMIEYLGFISRYRLTCRSIIESGNSEGNYIKINNLIDLFFKNEYC